MQSVRWTGLFLLTSIWLFLASSAAWAESGFLVVHVKDVHRHPIKGLQIGVEGDGGSDVTGDDGKARIRLANQTREKTWVSLQILKSPPGRDFVMVSPWDYRTIIPSFENESENFVEVVVVQSGDRAALESGTLLVAATERINKANALKSVDKQVPQEDLRANLVAVAKQYGLDPDELDKAIRTWGAEVTDPFEAGLAALYERDYPRASTQLAESLLEREKRLAADRNAVADAAFFLGESLYEEGKYRDSATSFARCLQLHPDDAWVMNNLALSLYLAGDHLSAEPLFRRALAINESAFGPNSPYVATGLNNLGLLLKARGEYAEAEPLFRRAIAIDESVLRPDHPAIATGLNNLALLLYAEGHYEAAEPFFRRALAIREQVFGPEDRIVAISLNNLGLLLGAKGNYDEAELLFRRALAIDVKVLGPDHPEVATNLSNLSTVLQSKHEYVAAEPFIRRALAIDENALGPDHPDVALRLNNLASLLQAMGEYSEAEALYRRALAIDETALGPHHPDVAVRLNNLADLLHYKGELAEAEPLYRRALKIREKALGPDHPAVATSLNNLAELLKDKGDYAEAEPLYLRALTIDEKALGPNHPGTERIRRNLESLRRQHPSQKQDK